jgi:hypothetical protein
LSFILPILFLTLLSHQLSEPHAAIREKTLREIYSSGKIEFEPVLKISLDSIPDRIQAKILIKLVHGPENIYVSDLGLSDIKMFKLSGKFIKKFGIKGRGPGDLYGPSPMCISKDRLVVWEIGNKRFSYFSLDGKFLKIEKPGLKGRLGEMKTLDDGRFILEVIRVEASREKKEIFEWRVLELYSDDMRFIKEIYRQKEHQFKYFKNPKPHYRMILPYGPKLHWDVLPQGKIAVSFSDKYEIKIIHIDSNHTKTISRNHPPVKVSKSDEKLYLDMQFNSEGGVLKRGASKFVRDNIEFPPYKPALKNIITDKAGYILVFPFTKSDDGKIYWMAEAFDVYDSNGVFINHVEISGNKKFYITRVISLDNNEFWCSEEEDLGVVFVKYKAM